MKVVISQPMFMPWRGMFEQMRIADRFVFYDDVQLPLGGGKGRGFITRVQIKTSSGAAWLSLPVARSERGPQLICEARLAHQDWRSEHMARIAQAYRSAPHFAWAMAHAVEPIYARQTDHVGEFCMHSMKTLAPLLGIACEPVRSSELDVPKDGSASARVLAVCRRMSGNEYLSGLGAIDYIDYDLFECNGVRIQYMDYDLSPYPQLHGGFTPHVSIIDLLFNVGPDAPIHLQGSRAVYWKDWPIKGPDGRPARSVR